MFEILEDLRNLLATDKSSETYSHKSYVKNFKVSSVGNKLLNLYETCVFDVTSGRSICEPIKSPNWNDALFVHSKVRQELLIGKYKISLEFECDSFNGKY